MCHIKLSLAIIQIIVHICIGKHLFSFCQRRVVEHTTLLEVRLRRSIVAPPLSTKLVNVPFFSRNLEELTGCLTKLLCNLVTNDYTILIRYSE